jgi:AhpD family alkylhydroperoxidase
MQGFDKRFYTPRSFFRDLRELVAHRSEIRETARSGRVSRAFAEKIMMAVTAVNQCRYCAHYHARLALKEDIPPDEIARILSLELDDFPPEEAVALAFAQHWAETEGQPDPDAERRFLETYGPQVSADIMNWMRVITMGNLLGNSWDALLSRAGLLWRTGIRRPNT